MRVRMFSVLMVTALVASAGCQSGPRPAPAGAPPPSALQAEWKASEQVLEQARAEHAQAERELAQLQRTIYQTALTLKRMKEQAEIWDRALVTNRAALLIVEDRMRELQRRAAAPTVAPAAPAPAPRKKVESATADAATGSVFKLVAKGNQRLREGDLAGAHGAFTEALRRDPTLLSARLGLAFCAYQQDDLVEARKQMREVLNTNPDQPQAIGLRGLMSWQEGRLAAALKDTARAVELDPQDAQLRKFHGMVLHSAQRTEEALAEMQEAARLNPRDGETLLNIAIMLARSEPPNLSEAGDYYRRALELGQSPEPNLDALLNAAKDAP